MVLVALLYRAPLEVVVALAGGQQIVIPLALATLQLLAPHKEVMVG
jgi:hypothetical protein